MDVICVHGYSLGEEEGGDVGLQGPGGVGVADDEGHVGDVVDHDAVVDDVLAGPVLLPVDGSLGEQVRVISMDSSSMYRARL